MSKVTPKRVHALVFAMLILFSMSAHASEGKESGEAKKDGPIYVDFKNIVVPVIKKNGATGVIALTLMAQVKDEKDKTTVTDNLPRLRDAFIRTLYGNMEAQRFVKQDGQLDIDRIKDKLMHSAQYVMQSKEESPIQDILFQNIAQQTY